MIVGRNWFAVLGDWFFKSFTELFQVGEKHEDGGIICIVFWACTGVLYFLLHICEIDVRKEYVRTFERYIGEPTGDLESLSLVFRQSGDYFTGDCELILKNATGEKMNRLLLFLNPDLAVKRVIVRGQEIPFVRDHQVLNVDMPLDVKDSVKLRVEYTGKIDGRICYLDIPDEEILPDFREYSDFSGWENKMLFWERNKPC